MTVTVNFTLDAGPARDPGALPTPQGTTTPTPPNWPANAIRVGGNIKPPTKIVDARPAYPQDAHDAKVQGVVILEGLIGEDGRVQDARILRSIPMLDKAAEEAVRQWIFTPTLLNGNPVPMIMTVTVTFTLM
jgi:protein TonB